MWVSRPVVRTEAMCIPRYSHRLAGPKVGHSKKRTSAKWLEVNAIRSCETSRIGVVQNGFHMKQGALEQHGGMIDKESISKEKGAHG